MPDNVQTDTTVSTDKWYKVTVTGIFDYAGEHYEPGTIYYVPEALYQGNLPGGASFASMCVNATPVDNY